MGPTIATNLQSTPKAGQKVIVRNRPALVRAVADHGHSRLKTLHEVQVDYIDNWSHPESDTLIWELERNTTVFSGLAMPSVEDQDPDEPPLLEAFLYANKWSAVNRLAPHHELDESQLHLVSPWHSAIQVEDYQLFPVLQSLLMPRISLLLADDVGLGKTIEAGLILSELFVRRRIRRVLIICPASLQIQWRDEMREKFHLDFTIVDRDETFKLQRELGVDSNPWESYPRIITSMDYLRQKDILASFMGATQRLSGHFDALLPWQMLVVDEVHNLAPSSSSFGDNSDRCNMLRELSQRFEHRLFLSATPHNGFTTSFTGLLELLDPVRFQQKPQLDETDKNQIELTMIRRLKKELNIAGEPERFADRQVHNLDIRLSPEEKALFDALRTYRFALHALLDTKSKRERHLGEFLSKLLTKRLLSGSYAFARTWWRHVEGLEVREEQKTQEEAQDVAVVAITAHSIERAEMVMNDDQERGQREEDAVRQTGSWLHRYANDLREQHELVSTCLEKLGWGKQIIEEISIHPQALQTVPFPQDARWDKLHEWIIENLTRNGKVRDDERLIIFTEYKHTLDYLMESLRRAGFASPQIESLFGGASSSQRELIKTAFNDPKHALRILIGTDTVSEGISLQMTCRYVIHQEIPWNPMRLEQRNGRVDRHGQEREVSVFHFSSNDEADLNFMEAVVKKVERARSDLGSVGQVIDQTVTEYFVRGLTNARDVLDYRVQEVQRDAQDVLDLSAREKDHTSTSDRAMQRLNATQINLGLSAKHAAQVFMTAVEHEGGMLEEIEKGKAYRLRKEPPSWKKLVKETIGQQRGSVYSIPKLVFEPSYFEDFSDGRRIFKPRTDAVLIRLGHPLMRRAIGVLRRRMWDGQGLNRWTIQSAPLLHGTRGILLLTLFLEITNKFHEIAHQEVIQIPFHMRGNQIERNDDLWEQIKTLPRSILSNQDYWQQVNRVRERWPEHRDQLRDFVLIEREKYQRDFEQRMQQRMRDEHKREQDNFDARIQELERQKTPRYLRELEQAYERQSRMVKKYEQQARVPSLFPEINIERQQAQREAERHLQEIAFDKEQAEAHIIRMKNVVERERKRVLERVLPERYALATVDLQPLTIEYIVPAVGRGLTPHQP